MDLNNRFALDGHSPPSMAGLLGCMGLFETKLRHSHGAAQARQSRRRCRQTLRLGGDKGAKYGKLGLRYCVTECPV